MKRSLLTECALMLALTAVPRPSLAEPVLDRCAELAQGLRACPDQEKTALWYLFPAPPRLAVKDDGTPDYSLTLYHYVGRQSTGDETRYWASGILSLRVQATWQGSLLKQARKTLQRQGIQKPYFKPVPVARSHVILVFGNARIEQELSGRWVGQTLTLPLDAAMAQVLAGTLEKQGTAQVTLMLDQTLKGVGKSGNEWHSASLPVSASLSIRLDSDRYPDRFRRIPVEQRMDIAYTQIEVRCHDFQEEPDSSIYLEKVEMALQVPNGEEIKEAVFRRGSPPKQVLKFSRAANLQKPYRVRVTCVYRDGRVETGPWQEKKGEGRIDLHHCQVRDFSPALSIEE